MKPYWLPNDVMRCSGIEADNLRECPIKIECLRFMAELPQHPNPIRMTYAPKICTIAIPLP